MSLEVPQEFKYVILMISFKEELTKSSIIEIQPGYSDSKGNPVKLSGQFMEKYFRTEQSADEIEKTITSL